MLLTQAKYTTGRYLPVRFYTTEKYLHVWGDSDQIQGGRRAITCIF
jgi:hypothetical protein